MTRTTGLVHAAYTTQAAVGGSLPGGTDAVELDDIRIHGSKVAALEDAVDRGAKYVPWPHGMTLTEAIAAYDASRNRAPSAVPRKRAKPPSPVSVPVDPNPDAEGAEA